MKHLICGDSAAGSLRKFLQVSREDMIVLLDTLSIGRLVPLNGNTADFVAARITFWRDCNEEELSSWIEERYAGLFEQISTAEKLTVWLSPGAHDQIMWAWLSHLLPQLGIAQDRVHIKHFWNNGEYTLPYLSLGPLQPEKYALCGDFDIGSAEIASLREAYVALCEPRPEKLLALCRQRELPLSELQNSLQAYLQQYPDYRTGLNIFDRTLLANCREKPLKVAYVLGQTLSKIEGYLHVGDLYLLCRLERMVHAPYPLAQFSTVSNEGYFIRDTAVQITPLGMDVLAGTKNHIALNGIDEYIGGVHLSAAEGATWFHKDHSLIEG